jgi:cytochrome c-type biogenesis protein CcmH/NrfF
MSEKFKLICPMCEKREVSDVRAGICDDCIDEVCDELVAGAEAIPAPAPKT